MVDSREAPTVSRAFSRGCSGLGGGGRPRPRPIEAARHLCEEARVVLSSLRGGPPAVARGALAADLRDLRSIVRSRFLDPPPPPPQAVLAPSPTPPESTAPSGATAAAASAEELCPPTPEQPTSTLCGLSSESAPRVPDLTNRSANAQDAVGADLDVGPYARPFLSVVVDPRAAGPHTLVALRALHRLLERRSLVQLDDADYDASRSNGNGQRGGVGDCYFAHAVSLEPLMRGVLACRFEQTDAGADEAVEMAIADLLSLIVDLDANGCGGGGDAAEAGLSSTEGGGRRRRQRRLRPETLMEAFNTVFVTRNTFVHSPALCYHFEEVLTGMAAAAFAGVVQNNRERPSSDDTPPPVAARLILEFLVNQLLHTPLLGPGGLSGDAPAHTAGGPDQAQALHDATRVLCLRLTRCCLQTGWGDAELMMGGGFGHGGDGGNDRVEEDHEEDDAVRGGGADTTKKVCSAGTATEEAENKEGESAQKSDRGGAPIIHGSDAAVSSPWDEEWSALLRIIDDDLCLSLLMTGQAIWAYHDPFSPSAASASNELSSPGVVSLEVLSEICATLSTLWNIGSLRRRLWSQFESIFTGLYQRALSLLRRRPVPDDSDSFHANLVFDAEVEIILESLVDILCLHGGEGRSGREKPTGVVGNGKGTGSPSALETLFATFDCNMSRSDVASGLIVELCRCCGGTIGEDGEVLLNLPSVAGSSAPTSGVSTPIATPTATPKSSEMTPTPGEAGDANGDTKNSPAASSFASVFKWRHVPAHLKELCAEALLGSMKCLFRETSATAALSAMRRASAEGAGTGTGEDAAAATQNDEPPPELPQELSTMTISGPDSDDAPRPADGRAFDGKPRSLRYNKHQKRLIRRAAALFNEKSSKGIQFLVSNGILPSPVTPQAVATFLRNGLVVGLDKKAVGMYLGEVGKAPVAGKSPPSWERDWFHKEVLSTYCSLFRFERQSLLDGLRMFLAAFRLPGEAQQIDRILQAFAESCGRMCDESTNGRLKLFSPDEKKASDAAYLLSFSIIMLNTDRHNDNIRADRKMTMEDFVKNNTDYGRDITDKGHELPREFLEGIYKSISHEEIRTHGEGADGVMTVERWKDVLGGSGGSSSLTTGGSNIGSTHDAEDFKELVLENAWMPIFSAIGGFWGVTMLGESMDQLNIRGVGMDGLSRSGMLGAQGARLGMDLAVEMLSGVRNLGRTDIFQEMFINVCNFSGLLGEYTTNASERVSSFTHSVERQSAVIVAINTAKDAGDTIGTKGWKSVWGMIFELRDLKLLGGGKGNKRRSIMVESDPDLLTEDSRREWTMRLVKEGLGWTGSENKGGRNPPRKAMSFVFGAMGRAFFGSEDESSRGATTTAAASSNDPRLTEVENGRFTVVRTLHGKEELVLWDDLAPSDDEVDIDDDEDTSSGGAYSIDGDRHGQPPNPSTPGSSAGAAFESQLIHEDHLVFPETPVTGLERIDDTRAYQPSARARVRKRLALVCDFSGLVSESRFLSMDGIQSLLEALMQFIEESESCIGGGGVVVQKNTAAMVKDGGEELLFESANVGWAISPASEALAEILVCEIALKNRDRIGVLWDTILCSHYRGRLGSGRARAPPKRQTSDSLALVASSEEQQAVFTMTPGIEKCVTGLLRICCWTVHREEIANKVLGTLKVLYPPEGGLQWSPGNLQLDKHLAEGLWRLCRNVDGLRQIGVEGWDGLLGLVEWCAMRGNTLGRSGGLSEDDPALQAFRSLHLMLHAAELKDVVPFGVVSGIRALVVGGEKGNCPKLSIAGLDLLLVLHTRLESLIAQTTSGEEGQGKSNDEESGVWVTCWLPVLEGMAEAAETSRFANVRQHALSMLTDAILDRHGRAIPDDQLCNILNSTCIPLAGKRITDLLRSGHDLEGNWEEIMIELELCISLIFKPFLHHLKTLITVEGEFVAIWISIIAVMTQLLGDEVKQGIDADTIQDTMGPRAMTREKLLRTTKELGSEHLRNAIMILIAHGILNGDETETTAAESKGGQDISAVTWAAIGSIGFCKGFVEEWKKSANEASTASEQGETKLESAAEVRADEEPDNVSPMSEGGEDTCERP